MKRPSPAGHLLTPRGCMLVPGWACLLVLAAGATPAQADNSAPLVALQQARARGCEGRPGQPAPLKAEARLMRAAERLSRGEPLQAAMGAEGYRAQRASAVALRGHPGVQGLARGLGQHACTALLDAAWQQVGFHQRGDAGWVILAAPFSPPRPEDEAQTRAEMLQLVNQARSQARHCGTQAFDSAGPVQLNGQLHRAAAAHAADMAEHSYFSHTGRDGSQIGDRASRAGYAWRRIGENLAAGQTTAAAAVQGWLASPSHCANLMQPVFTEMGLAYAVNPQSREGIYWVQVLGTPR